MQTLNPPDVDAVHSPGAPKGVRLLRMSILLTALALTGCVGNGKYQRTRADLEAATLEGKTVHAQLLALEQTQAGTGEKVAALEAELTRSRGALAAQREQLDALGGLDPATARGAIQAHQAAMVAAVELARQAPLLEDALRPELAAETVQIVLEDGILTIRWAERTCFEAGKLEPLPPCRDQLLRVAGTLREASAVSVMARVAIDGSTAPRGAKAADAWTLSSGRAAAVARLMIGEGIRGGRLSATGTGIAAEPASSGLELVLGWSPLPAAPTAPSP